MKVWQFIKTNLFLLSICHLIIFLFETMVTRPYFFNFISFIIISKIYHISFEIFVIPSGRRHVITTIYQTFNFKSCLLNFRAKDECAFNPVLPEYLFFECPNVGDFWEYLWGEQIWLWSLWYLSQVT